MPNMPYIYGSSGIPVTINKYIYSGTTVEPNIDEPKLKQFPLKI